MSTGTWEEAVRWYRSQPQHQGAVLHNYFDLPVLDAARRYAASMEFAEVARLLGLARGRPLLDLGAGNGIASFAFATADWQVTALEPDPSDEVGAGAIRLLREQSSTPITVVQDWGEHLPFPDAAFSAVFGRQVLHHARDLQEMVREVARVLRPGGSALFIRDHVAENEGDLEVFRAAHPLHHLYGGEAAFPASRYRQAFADAGLVVRREWGPVDSIINFYPGAESRRRVHAAVVGGWRLVRPHVGKHSRRIPRRLALALDPDLAPGRLISFLLVKP